MRVSVKYIIKIYAFALARSAHVKLGVRITAVPLPAKRGIKNGCADPNAISCFAWIDSAAILQMNLTHSIRFGLFQPGLTGNIACLYHRHFCTVEVCVAGAGFFSGKGKSLRTHARSRALLRDLQIKPNQKNWLPLAMPAVKTGSLLLTTSALVLEQYLSCR